ncbi:MAG: glycosyl hydrolase, partial [Planctomycetes bacterium]|nr:glycosyl hydrolase [Planctomycetota bacterium]
MSQHSRLCGSIAWLAACLTLTAASVCAQRIAPAEPADFTSRLAADRAHRELLSRSLGRGLAWRSVGPIVQGGRIVDIESVPGSPKSLLAAYASGGLWRSDNAGQSFRPIFDAEPTLIMGDIGVDPQNPERIWVGTGENNASRSSYGGLGVFRSDDGGKTFQHMGLGDTDRIGRIIVDPRDGDRVLVAASGSLYTTRGDRGVFLTEDGGKTWNVVIAGDGMAGAIDLALAPGDPDTVYAATWDRSRRPWNFVESGVGSAIWKSIDGGRNWKRIEGGFPQGSDIGRIGLATSPAAPDTIYACVDHQGPLEDDRRPPDDSVLSPRRVRAMTVEEFLSYDPRDIDAFLRGNDFHEDLDAEALIGGLESGEITLTALLDDIQDGNAALFDVDIRGLEVWRSDDRGDSWRRTHDEPLEGVTFSYGYYFGQIRVAPDDVDRVWTMGVPLIASEDGGKTWRNILGAGVHVDNHALWIDPADSKHLILGNDGGLDETYDAGENWRSIDAQAVGQFYTVELDDAKPFNIIGGLQDNGTLKGSSRADRDDGPSWS